MEKGIINVFHTHIEIEPYELGQSLMLEKMLSRWDGVRFTLVPVAFFFNDKTKILYIPRNISEYFLVKEFPYYKVNHIPKYSNFEPISKLKLDILPRDENQKESIAFILGEKDYIYTKKYSQLFLNLETGEGKTYCAIASISILRMRTIIIVNDKTIKSQWYDSLLKFTNLTEHDIQDVSGSSNMLKMIENPNKVKNKKVFIVIHRSIQSFAKKYGWDEVRNFFDKLKFGLKIIDEAHKEFHNTVMVDCFSNVKKTLYLTASAGRSEYKENKIFNKVFDSVPKFGNKFKSDDNKYIKISIMKYNSHPSYEDQANCQTRLGFSINKYIDYCTGKGKKKFFEILIQILNITMKHDEKTAILVGKIEAAIEIKRVLEDIYHIPVGNFTSHTKDHNDKIKELDNKIIVSTSKSLGVGTDVRGLRFLIMCEPYSSDIMAQQIPGRLRKQGKPVMYFEMVDIGFNKIKNQYRSRRDTLRKKAEKFMEIDCD